jgi:hypothetical protein
MKEEYLTSQQIIEAAYKVCEQNYLVVGNASWENHIDGRLEINGLQLEGEDMLSLSIRGAEPRADFLSFMYAHGWEIVSFNGFSVYGTTNGDPLDPPSPQDGMVSCRLFCAETRTLVP